MEFTPKNRATVQNMPKLPYAVEEALNRLRVNVSFLGSKVKKIMVISSAPDEGKSFIAMQLWRQMAEAGSKSILVDMDLRKSVMVDKYQIVREDNGKFWELPIIWQVTIRWTNMCCVPISEREISFRIKKILLTRPCFSKDRNWQVHLRNWMKIIVIRLLMLHH